MISILYNLSFLHDDDCVRVDDGGETMRNQNSANLSEFFLHMFD